MITVDDIVDEGVRLHLVAARDVIGNSRFAFVVKARHSIVLAAKHAGFSIRKIADALSRDHSTISYVIHHAEKRHDLRNSSAHMALLKWVDDRMNGMALSAEERARQERVLDSIVTTTLRLVAGNEGALRTALRGKHQRARHAVLTVARDKGVSPYLVARRLNRHPTTIVELTNLAQRRYDNGTIKPETKALVDELGELV